MKLIAKLALLVLVTIGFVPALKAAGPVDSCALVTTDELAQILNAKIGPPVKVETPRPHCEFAVTGKAMLKKVTVWAYHESAKTAFENGKTGLAPIQAVPNLGDEAYFGTQLMNVLKGSIYLQVQLIFPRGVNVLEVEKKIAEKAVDRLP